MDRNSPAACEKLFLDNSLPNLVVDPWGMKSMFRAEKTRRSKLAIHAVKRLVRMGGMHKRRQETVSRRATTTISGMLAIRPSLTYLCNQGGKSEHNAMLDLIAANALEKFGQRPEDESDDADDEG